MENPVFRAIHRYRQAARPYNFLPANDLLTRKLSFGREEQTPDRVPGGYHTLRLGMNNRSIKLLIQRPEQNCLFRHRQLQSYRQTNQLIMH